MKPNLTSLTMEIVGSIVRSHFSKIYKYIETLAESPIINYNEGNHTFRHLHIFGQATMLDDFREGINNVDRLEGWKATAVAESYCPFELGQPPSSNLA